jgi:hypothetical protein
MAWGKKRKWMAALAMVAALASAMVWLGSAERQPRFEGIELETWLMACSGKPNVFPGDWTRLEPDRATNAVRQMGAEALPLLIQWVGCEQRAWEGKMWEKLQKQSGNLPTFCQRWIAQGWERQSLPARRAELGLLGFEILGAAASPAASVLSRRLRQTRAPEIQRRLLFALHFTGESGFEALANAVTNSPKGDRALAVFFIGQLGKHGQLSHHAHDANSILIGCLQETNPQLAVEAGIALGEIRQEPERVIPALTNALMKTEGFRRYFTAESLGLFGEPARVALPHLRTLPQYPIPSSMYSIGSVVMLLDPQTPESQCQKVRDFFVRDRENYAMDRMGRAQWR